MDLDITFDRKAICTPVYIGLESSEPLLLSKGVCRQLGTISHHPTVEVGQKQMPVWKKDPVRKKMEVDNKSYSQEDLKQ